MKKKIMLLAGFTVRSKFYAQALAACRQQIDEVILFGREKAALPGQAHNVNSAKKDFGLFLPDLEEGLMKTCSNQKWQVHHLECMDVNDLSVYNKVIDLNPELIIYSGYGGQIVNEKFLNSGIPFLHIHCGWLPKYKGSTTIYYSLLKDGKCGVSGILLSSEIDNGKIVKQRYYPAPPPEVDIDYIYDNAIRADLLTDILAEYINKGSLTPIDQQEKGITYYVIHPVLKHLSLLGNLSSQSGR